MKIIDKAKTWFKRGDKTPSQRIKEIAGVFGTLDTLQQRGLIHYQQRDRRLFLALPLALVQLRSRKAWDTFAQNVMLWAVYNRQQEAWERKRIECESKAVSKAIKEHGRLTDRDITAIRLAAREQLTADMVPVPQPEDFEVFIIDEHSQEIAAVGSYHALANRTDFAMWEDVKEQVARRPTPTLP